MSADEIQAAFDRGFELGRESISALPAMLLGVVVGALSTAVWLLILQ